MYAQLARNELGQQRVTQRGESAGFAPAVKPTRQQIRYGSVECGDQWRRGNHCRKIQNGIKPGALMALRGFVTGPSIICRKSDERARQ